MITQIPAQRRFIMATNATNSNNLSYDVFSKFLHWLTAVLLIGLVALGWYMTTLQDLPGSDWYFNLHVSFGLIAASIIVLRIIWRLSQPPMPLPITKPRWQAKFSKIIHWLLYFCLFAMPFTGFIGESLSKYGVSFFGVALPVWFAKNETLSKQFFNLHYIFAWTLVALVSLHVLAALKHLFINKDRLFQRMWF